MKIHRCKIIGQNHRSRMYAFSIGLPMILTYDFSPMSCPMIVTYEFDL